MDLDTDLDTDLELLRRWHGAFRRSDVGLYSADDPGHSHASLNRVDCLQGATGAADSNLGRKG
jgi:hypothetical protein